MDEKDYWEKQRELADYAARVEDITRSVNLPALRVELEKLEQETRGDDFWKEQDRFAEVNQRISFLKKKIVPWEQLLTEVKETGELLEMALVEGDASLLDEIVVTIGRIGKTLDELETRELLSGEDDIRDAFISIHPGAGGTESQDWASMLFRLYYRWGEENGYKISVYDYTPGEEAGIKSATMHVSGEYAYGMLKSETGIHRLVRISPFDSNKRRHTSFASVELLPDIPDEIDVEINESDLRIDTYRASGAGGQHVNTSDSAVRITHNPTGIVVQCQNERSQHKNRAFAMKVLKVRLYEHYKQLEDEKKLDKIGERKDISWGNQIRSYVFQPYTLVKDHRTGEEMGNIEAVFDGAIDRFIYAYLKKLKAAT